MTEEDGEYSRDVDFADSVRRAALANGPAEQEVFGADLALLLRSDRPLGRGERAMLAELVTGQLAKYRGRPQVSIEQKRKIVRRVQELRNKPMQEKAAVGQTAAEFDMSATTVREYCRENRKFDEAVRKAEGAGRKMSE